jgi:cell division protein FtsZ
MRESEPETAAQPPRFMSEEDDSESDTTEKGFVFSAAAPGVSTTVTVASAPAKEGTGRSMGFASDADSATSTGPQFADSGSESDTDLQRRDYAGDFAATPRGAAEPGTEAGAAMFAGPAEQPERDLDVPTFLRRLKF